jgi:hypothetical protein
VAGLAGSVAFWLVQTVTGGPTITAFMGEQIVAVGGYPQSFTTLIGWAVHLAVSLSYAFLFAVLVLFLGAVSFPARAVASLFGALGLGWVTAVMAPPAISVTVGLLGRHGWPAELFPLNTELGLPLWNHLLFFLLNWAIQVVGPRLIRRA